MQLFYNSEINSKTNKFTFSKEESKHIIKVLRKDIGDELHITNGEGWVFKAKIEIPSVNKCSVKIVSKNKQPDKKYHLHLAVAPTKMNDRYEWFLEKATEIGIDSITPIICEHSERKFIKAERYNKILQSAMKQSLKANLPKLQPLIKLEEFLKKRFTGQQFIAHCEDFDKKPIQKELKANQDTTILIGPEGDFSVKEIELAIKNNFTPITLGKSRLRTETAAIVACHSVAFINEL